MAIYRTIQLSFWTDNKVVDDFTPEDKYFYLYLFTNPQTNLCGCYEVSVKTMADQLGYSKDTVMALLERFEKVHQVIKYSTKTKELLLLNWSKYNWTSSPNFVKGLKEQLKYVKNLEFKGFLQGLIDEKDSVDIPSTDGMGTSVTVTNNNITNNYSISINNIINYLNNKLNTNYRSNSKKNKSLITARLNEGFTEEDFYTVIDKKFEQWFDDPKMSPYLRPETLFGTKFEGYLNEKVTKKNISVVDKWANI